MPPAFSAFDDTGCRVNGHLPHRGAGNLLRRNGFRMEGGLPPSDLKVSQCFDDR